MRLKNFIRLLDIHENGHKQHYIYIIYIEWLMALMKMRLQPSRASLNSWKKKFLQTNFMSVFRTLKNCCWWTFSWVSWNALHECLKYRRPETETCQELLQVPFIRCLKPSKIVLLRPFWWAGLDEQHLKTKITILNNILSWPFAPRPAVCLGRCLPRLWCHWYFMKIVGCCAGENGLVCHVYFTHRLIGLIA